MKRNEDNIKGTNIWIIGISEKEEKKKRYEKTFAEIIVKNFPNKRMEIATHPSAENQESVQDKPTEKHDKKHTNHTNKN